MRFRSSTNCEDLGGFTGAGLYDSQSGDPNDPSRPVADAVRAVWASVWGFRAFEEREYRSISHGEVGMAVLVHRSFPDEAANGVAITANIFDPMGIEPGYYINAQAGDVSVVLPPEGVTSDQFIYHFDMPRQPIVFIAHSSLVPEGETVMSRAQTAELAEALEGIHGFFNGVYGPNTPEHFFGMDVEFKFNTDDPDPDAVPELVIKQARPYPGRSATGTDVGVDSHEDTDTDSDTDTQADTESAGDSETETEMPAWVDTEFDTDPSAVTLGGPCPLDRHIGGFKVEMNAEVGYTAIDGTVWNGVDPALVPDVALEEGDCRLLKQRRLICDPPCPSGKTCTPEATCEAMPVGQDVGIALFQGLVKTIFVEPVQPGNTYFYTRLDHPGFANGDVIRLTTSGGYIDALDLYGVGVEPLYPAKDQWVLEEGRPLVIEWPAPPEGTRSTMRVTLNIDQHGLTPVTLVCDLEDTGSATIPSSVIDALIQSGVTGFPSATAVRRTVDSLDGEAGCVEFQVASVGTADVEVTGYIPCTSNDNCPDPLTCNREIQQCQ